jgi:probable HAF family extracellular repeat protein
MNAFGQVVGYSGVYSDDQWGFFWTTAGGMNVFGGSWPPTFVSGVNNRGQIVGQNSAFPTFGIGHGTSWEHDVATDLGTLGGGAEVVDYSSAANGVNDLGQIVGWSTITPISFAGWLESSVHAVWWPTAGGIRDLGTLPGDTLSAASKINFFGKVIGSSGNTAVFPWFVTESSPYEVIGCPFIWSQRNGMRDLNTLIPVNSGWVLSSASDINSWGQIVGSGMLNGQPHGFLLTPRDFLKNGR